MQIPPYLKPGDTIGITCPSGFLPLSKTIFARQTLMEWGFKVFVGPTVGREYFYFSDTDEKRLADLQAQLDNPEIKAILMGRGGYGMSRIIDALDFSKFCDNPKWINGFSDITVLHSHIQSNFNIATLHGPMCGAFKGQQPEPAPLNSLKKALTGEPVLYPIPVNAQNRTGKATGVLVGGNLAILAHLTGSVSHPDTR
jgi:muramoyltetrapeptide carboxypeptidase